MWSREVAREKSRRRVHSELRAENIKLLKRLQEVRPVYSVDKWDSDRLTHEKRLRRLQWFNNNHSPKAKRSLFQESLFQRPQIQVTSCEFSASSENSVILPEIISPKEKNLVYTPSLKKSGLKLFRRKKPLEIGYNMLGCSSQRSVLYRNTHSVSGRVLLVEVSRNKTRVFVIMTENPHQAKENWIGDSLPAKKAY